VFHHDRRDDEIQAAGTMTLQFEGAIADLAKPVEADSACQRIARFALVQPGGDALAQCRIEQSFDQTTQSTVARGVLARSAVGARTSVGAKSAVVLGKTTFLSTARCVMIFCLVLYLMVQFVQLGVLVLFVKILALCIQNP
jgi:hypothetical protein